GGGAGIAPAGGDAPQRRHPQVARPDVRQRSVEDHMTSTNINATVVGDEERADVAGGDTGVWRDLVGRLNRQSTDKHFDAYADVAWDDPEMRIDRHDPRWELT